jgi:pentatricopeptide repeat protein
VKPLRAGPVPRRAPRRPCRGGGLRRRYGAILLGTSSPLAAADPFVISLAFKACAAAAADATSLHASAVSSAVTSVYVATALADAYAKAGRLAFALSVFDEMPRKDVVSWIPLVGALTRHDALHRFAEMRASGVPCDSHACVVEHHAMIRSALVDM